MREKIRILSRFPCHANFLRRKNKNLTQTGYDGDSLRTSNRSMLPHTICQEVCTLWRVRQLYHSFRQTCLISWRTFTLLSLPLCLECY